MTLYLLGESSRPNIWFLDDCTCLENLLDQIYDFYMIVFGQRIINTKHMIYKQLCVLRKSAKPNTRLLNKCTCLENHLDKYMISRRL